MSENCVNLIKHPGTIAENGMILKKYSGIWSIF